MWFSRKWLFLFLTLALTLSGTGTVSGHPGGQHRFSVQEERIAENPDDPVPYLTRAVLWGQKSHWNEALEDLDRAEARGGDPLDIALVRIEALQALQKWDKALVAADQALAVAPELARARRSRGLVLVALGRSQEAARELATAFAQFEDPSPALVVELAEALVAAGRTAEARRHLDMAMERLGPRSLLLRSALGLELESRGPEAAERKLVELVDGGQELHRLQFHHRLLWAEVLMVNGYFRGARKVLSELLADSSVAGEKAPRGAQRLRRRAHEALERLDSASEPSNDSNPTHGKR